MKPVVTPLAKPAQPLGVPSEEALRAALNASGDIVYDWDVATGTIAWSETAGDAFGVDVLGECATASAFERRIHPDDVAARARVLADRINTAAAYDMEYRVRRADGSFAWVHDRGAALADDSGRAERLVGALRTVTARKEREAQLEFLASYDELTGHLNRARLREALSHTVAYALRYDAPAAYLLVGIDNLTLINSAYGMDVADTVIVQVSQRIEGALRASDLIGRVAGNRLGIVLTSCAEEDMGLIAEKLLRAVRGQPIETRGGALSVTISIGGVALPRAARTAHAAMLQAEEALDRAKANGRDCFEPYIVSDSRELLRKRNVAIAEQVVGALKDWRLKLAYQPIIDVRTGAIAQYECLLRMLEPDGTVISAGDFIPVVEQLGLVRLVDRRTLDLAFAALEKRPDAHLALNVSGLTASDQSWLRSMLAVIRTRRDMAERLTVEITETVAIRDMEETARFVGTLRELGCKVALDDFGAGYTSFRHLKSLAVDSVKIDGSFVRNVAVNKHNQLFVKTLLDLANAFNLATVAEGVETQADADLLKGLGVRYLQGYLFGRPSFAPFED
jgi:diguanylate cyclase (GGDEF)-like protein/PAS domain S-box-containing protein